MLSYKALVLKHADANRAKCQWLLPVERAQDSIPSRKVQNFFFTGPKFSSLTIAGSSSTFFSTYTIMLFSWKQSMYGSHHTALTSPAQVILAFPLSDRGKKVVFLASKSFPTCSLHCYVARNSVAHGILEVSS